MKKYLPPIGFLMVLTFFVGPSIFAQKAENKFRKIQNYIDEATDDNLVGLAVLIESPKYGKWIGTSGYANLDKQTPLIENNIFSLASIGKLYTAVAVLKLAEDAKLRLDDPISRYLPQEIIDGFPTAGKTTVRHLLQHTSGLYNYNRNPELNELYLSGNLQLDTLSHMDALRGFAYGRTEGTRPLGQFKYSSTNYLLLSMIMDKVLENGHEDYIRKELIKKHGLLDTYYKETPPERLVNHYGYIDKNGVPDNLSKETIETTNWYSGDDGIYSTIEEASKFLRLLMDGKILEEHMMKEMTTWDDEKNPSYGLGLMADKGFPYKFLMGHSGRGIGITCDLYYFPNQKMTIAIFCNTGVRSGSKAIGKSYFKMRKKIVKKLFLF